MADEEIKTLAVKLALEDGTFQQGMRNLRQQLGVASSEFDAAGGKVKGFGNTLDGVKANAQALGDKIKATNEIVSQYKAKIDETQATLQKQSDAMMKNKTAMEEADAEYRKNLEELGANDEATVKSKAALNEQTDAYKRSEAQVRKTESSINGYTIQMNKATGEIKKMQSELANNNGFAVVSQHLEDAGKKTEAVGKKISNFGQSWSWGVSLPIAAAGTAAVKMATDFETSSAKVSTIADTSVVSMAKMKKGALELSTSTNTDVNDINQALYQAMSAGIKTGNALKFVGDSVKLAKGGFTDDATAINTLTSVLNAYHMKASAANSISDQLIKTQDLGKTTVGELGQSLGQVIPTAANLNVKTQDLFASIAELTKNGMPASEAITAVRASLSSILKPSTEAGKAAKQMGIDFSATHLQNVGFAKFIDEIAKATGGNAQKMSDLFKNVRALNGMMVLAGKGNKDYNETLKKMYSATGATNDAFEKVESTGAAKMEKAINTIKNDGIEAGEKLMPAVAGVADDIAKLADGFSKLTPQMQNTIIKIAAITAVIGPATWAVGGITRTIGDLASGIGTAIGGIGNFVKGLSGVEVAAGEAVPAAMKFGSMLGTLGPEGVVGIAAAAIGAVALAIYTFTQNSQNAKQPADDLMKSIDDEAKAWKDLKKQPDDQTATDVAEVDHVQNLWNWLQKNVTATGKLKTSKQLAATVVDQINKTVGKQELKLVGDTVVGYQKEKKAIDDAIAAKKAQILLQDKEGDYKSALKNYQDAEKKQAQLAIDIANQQAKIKSLTKENNGGDISYINSEKTRRYDAQEYAEMQSHLVKMKSELAKGEKLYRGYTSTISDYDKAYAAEKEGNYKTVANILDQQNLKYTAATGATKKQLEAQVQLYSEETKQMQQRYKSGTDHVTKEMVDEAEKQTQNAKAELKKFGIETAQSAADGAKSKENDVKAAGQAVGKAAVDGAKSSTGAMKKAGSDTGKSLADGINSSKSAIKKAGHDSGDAFLDGLQSFMNSIGGALSDFFIPKAKTSANKKVGHNASGTDNWRGGLSWVGEKGPELLNLPQGSQILSNADSMKMTSGATLPNMLKGMNAQTWGADMMKSFGQGITMNEAIVIASVASVANGIHDYIGFSKPKKGALKDADTYGTDFMKLVADTIKANESKPADAVKKVGELVKDRVSKIQNDLKASTAKIKADMDKNVSGIKDTTAATLKKLNSQLQTLETQRTKDLRSNSAERTSVETDYSAKIQALRDKIANYSGKSKNKSSYVKGLKAEIEELEKAEKSASKNVGTTEKDNISDTYKAKIKAIKDEIAAVKDQSSKEKTSVKDRAKAAIAARKAQSSAEIAEIKKIGTANEDELKTEIANREALVSNVNTLDDEIKDALSKQYQQDEQNQEDAINNKLTDLDNWKTQSENTINSIYGDVSGEANTAEDGLSAYLTKQGDIIDDVNAQKEQSADAAASASDKALSTELSDIDTWKTAQTNAIIATATAQKAAIQSQIDTTTAEINSVQAQLDALDAKSTEDSRADTRKGYTDKISDLQGQIDYSHDDYNTAQLKKQLAQEQAAYQKELDNEATEDKKAALQKQLETLKTTQDEENTALKKSQQDALNSIDAVNTAVNNSLNKQLTAVKNTYEKETTDASLEAKAEELIVDNKQKDIIALLNSYSDTYKMTGQTLGDRLADGFQPAVDRITAEIAAINSAISSANSAAYPIPSTSSTGEANGTWQTDYKPSSNSTGEVEKTRQLGKETINNVNINITSPVAQTPSQQARQAELAVQRAYFKVS